MTASDGAEAVSDVVNLLKDRSGSFSFSAAGPAFAARVCAGFLRRRSSYDLEKFDSGGRDQEPASPAPARYAAGTKLALGSWALEALLLLALAAASLTWRLRCAVTAPFLVAYRALRTVRPVPYPDSAVVLSATLTPQPASCCCDTPSAPPAGNKETLPAVPAPPAAIPLCVRAPETPQFTEPLAPCTPPTVAPQSVKAARLTVCLDMDDTLVYATRKHSTPYRLLEGSGDLYAIRQHSIPFGRGADIEAPFSGEVVVLERPRLHDFLTELKSFADVVLFTAGLESYAKPIVQRIDPDGKYFQRVLYRDATVSTNGRENVKDLKCIGKRMEKVVLVDNSPFSFMMQPNNGIPILPFGGDAEDEELMTVTLPLLKELAETDDIRPMLASKFNMVHWFARKGVVLPKGCTLIKPSA